jgi:hypothetical protein
LFGELRALAANLIQLFLLQLEIFCHQGPVRSRASRRHNVFDIRFHRIQQQFCRSPRIMLQTRTKQG